MRNSHGVFGEAPRGGGGGGGASSLRPAGRPQRSQGQESGISAVVAKTGRLSWPAEHQYGTGCRGSIAPPRSTSAPGAPPMRPPRRTDPRDFTTCSSKWMVRTAVSPPRSGDREGETGRCLDRSNVLGLQALLALRHVEFDV